MNENAQKWVEILRSDDYNQGVNRMKSDNGFCCLGVACDLYAQSHGKEWDTLRNSTDDGWIYSFLGHQNRLPYQVQNWLGLKDDVGKFKDMYVSDEDFRYVSLMDLQRPIHVVRRDSRCHCLERGGTVLRVK